MKTKFSAAVAGILVLLLAGCSSELKITLNSGGDVDIMFSAGASSAIGKMMSSFGGEEFRIDTDEIGYELAKSGFSDVKATTRTGTDLTVKMSDKKRNSYLFTSGILSCDGKKLTLALSPEKLGGFYNSADEQTKSFLDLLLAPVFNGETMSEAEYTETLASFYGNEAAEEIGKSAITIKLSDFSGRNTEMTLPLPKLLALTEEIRSN